MARTLQVESINSSSTGLDLQTLNASRLFIKSDGNVGIGTTSPSDILHVSKANGVSIFESTGVSSVGIRLRTNSTDRWQIGCPSASADLAIYTGAAATERLRIDSSGNVGIGNTPSQKLDVNGGSAIRGTLFLGDGSSSVIRKLTSSTPLTFANSGGSAEMTIDSSGNVGIGTTSPLRKLSVEGGGLGFQDSGGGNRSITWNDTTSTNLQLAIQGNSTTGNCFLAFQTNSFGSTATERMRIDSSGNVGIGTTSPIEQLQVSGTGRIHLGGGAVSTDTTAGIYFHGAGDTSYAIHRTTGAWTANTYQQLRISFNTGIVLDSGTANDRSFVRVDGTGIRVATGNIGIGTTTKTLNYKLDVYGTSVSDCVRIAASSTSSGIDFFDTSSGSLARKGIIYTNSEGIGILNSAAAWALRVNQGTTNVVIPTGSLTVGQDVLTNQNYGYGHVGLYSETRFQSVFAMGTQFTMKADGTSLSAGAGGNNFYGIAWSHPSAGGQAANLSNHGIIVAVNGITQTALTTSIWCIGNITAYSDERVKTNWRNFDNNFIEKLAKVKSGIFDRTDTTEQSIKTQVGVSAQSLREVIPDAVTCNSEGMLSVSYGNAAMASCVELAKEILKLKEEINKLKENK